MKFMMWPYWIVPYTVNYCAFPDNVCAAPPVSSAAARRVNGLLPSSTGVDNYFSCRFPIKCSYVCLLKLCLHHYALKWEKKGCSASLSTYLQNVWFNHFRSCKFFRFSSKTCVIYMLKRENKLFYRNAGCFPSGKLKYKTCTFLLNLMTIIAFFPFLVCRNALNA